MRRLPGFLFWLGVLFFIVGCGQNGQVIPTAVLQPVEQILPVETIATVTAVPPTATLPPTTAPDPTSLPTLTPAVETEAETAVTTTPPLTQLTIRQPAAGDDAIVGELITIEGSVTPVPTEPLIVRVLALGGDELVRATAVIDEATGEWTVTTTIPPQIVGFGQILAQLESQPDAVAVQVNLQPNEANSDRYILMDLPAAGGKVVAGYATLFHGNVLGALDETVTIAVQSAGCDESWTSSSLNLLNGRWQGWSVLPPTVLPGAACAVAFTGERGTETAREVRVPVTVLDDTDDRAQVLQLGNAGDFIFTAGAPAYIFGVAVQVPDNQVAVKLVRDDGQGTISEGTAVVNSFGYWEIDLDIPPDTPQNQALLIISMGSDDNYQEVRQVVFVQSAEGEG